MDPRRLPPPAPEPSLIDGWQRRITYLRVSITDRCNLRCVYCMPAEGMVWKPRQEILTFEEIVRVVRVARRRGVRKVRITGGEPLVRHGCDALLGLLAAEGVEELCLTTNGLRFAEQAARLKQQGLTRVNLSLDTLDPDKFRTITRGGELAKVLAALDAALDLDLQPRVNVVAMRGFNEDELPALAALSLDRPITVRFIEVMPFTGPIDERLHAAAGEAADCESRAIEPLPLEDVRERLGLPRQLHLSTLGELPVVTTDGPAEYTRLPGAQGQVGFIASMHDHICDRCNRVRLTADGWLRPCLLGPEQVFARDAARAGDEAGLEAAFDELMAIKPQHGLRSVDRAEAMSMVGG